MTAALAEQGTRPAPAATPPPAARGRRRRGLDQGVPRWQIYLPLCLYLLFTLVPFYWMLLFALRPAGSNALVPWPITGEHFQKVWNERSFGIFFQNSMIVGVASLVMTTAVALAGGYALARFDFRIKRGFMLALLASQFIPGALMLVPLFEIFKNLQMINSLGSVVIAETVFQLPCRSSSSAASSRTCRCRSRNRRGSTAAAASGPSARWCCRCCAPG